jgi:hypothetical protein
MNSQSGLSGHWTDEQIIEHLCGVGPSASHLDDCVDCRKRLSILRENRGSIEVVAGVHEVDPQLLSTQRRRIYARLSEEPVRRFAVAGTARWASAAAVVLALCGGLLFMEKSSHPAWQSGAYASAKKRMPSDSQLAVEVSQMAETYEPEPTEPLQALFGE